MSNVTNELVYAFVVSLFIVTFARRKICYLKGGTAAYQWTDKRVKPGIDEDVCTNYDQEQQSYETTSLRIQMKEKNTDWYLNYLWHLAVICKDRSSMTANKDGGYS